MQGHRQIALPPHRFKRIPGVIGVLQTLGILLLSLLMLQGVFPRALAWLGVATGGIGIVSEALRPVLGWAYSIYGLMIFASAMISDGVAKKPGSYSTPLESPTAPSFIPRSTSACIVVTSTDVAARR